jgi:multiple sugar transport system permease protein
MEVSMATAVSKGAAHAAARRQRQMGDMLNWSFLLPATFFFVGWQIYPILRVFIFSFTDYKYLRLDPPNFVGLLNYQNAIVDPLFHQGLLRAAAFTVMFVPLTIILPLLLAVLIDQVHTSWLAAFYRIVLLIPAVIPGPLVFVLWKWLYDFQIGPINHVLVDVLHVVSAQNAPQWLGGTPLSLVSVVIMEVWWGLGYHTIFFLAGLASIPKDLPEQARIDGANEWQLFWRVMVPRLMPILSVLVVLRFGTAMSVIDEYLIFGGFQRTSPTYSWTVYMYDLSFRIGDWLQGYASAIGWLGALVMMVFVVGLLYVFRSRD